MKATIGSKLLLRPHVSFHFYPLDFEKSSNGPNMITL